MTTRIPTSGTGRRRAKAIRNREANDRYYLDAADREAYCHEDYS